MKQTQRQAAIGDREARAEEMVRLHVLEMEDVLLLREEVQSEIVELPAFIMKSTKTDADLERLHLLNVQLAELDAIVASLERVRHWPQKLAQIEQLRHEHTQQEAPQEVSLWPFSARHFGL